MNNPNPFVPKGSLLEQQSQRRSRLKLAVFCVLAVSVTGLTAMLIQGCKREKPDTDLNPPLLDATNPPPMLNTNPSPYSVSNPPPQIPPLATNPPIIIPQVEATSSTYEVVAGDTLGKIAKAHGVSSPRSKRRTPLRIQGISS